eukprot:2471103-Rhodomonas_salina.1
MCIRDSSLSLSLPLPLPLPLPPPPSRCAVVTLCMVLTARGTDLVCGATGVLYVMCYRRAVLSHGQQGPQGHRHPGAPQTPTLNHPETPNPNAETLTPKH